jgi:hypothetical protein
MEKGFGKPEPFDVLTAAGGGSSSEFKPLGELFTSAR